MGVWKKTRIGDFLYLYRNEYIIQDDENYKQVTISKNHGISLRGSKAGKNIGRKRQFVIDLKNHPNTVLFTRQGIRDGAIGIAPAEIDGCIVTENMPMMSVDTNLIEIEYLRKLLLSEYLFDKIRQLNVTGSAQKSIHERDLLKIEIALPSLEKQRDECRRFNSLDIEHAELKTELTHQQTLLKKLRQQILQEAIEGKLTADWRADNPDVEPASELLARIQAEKAQLIKDKKIKKQKPLPPIGEDEKPFELPEGWVWCRLGDISEVKVGATPARENPEYWGGDVNWVSSGEVANNYIASTKETITKKGMNESSAKVNPKGSVLVAMIGQGKTRGQTAILKIDAATNQNVAAIRLASEIIPEIVWYFFLSRYEATRSGASGGNQPALNGIKIKSTVFALPSMQEAIEIIKRLRRTEQILNQLETQISQNQRHAEQLMQAVLKEAFTHEATEQGVVHA